MTTSLKSLIAGCLGLAVCFSGPVAAFAEPTLVDSTPALPSLERVTANKLVTPERAAPPPLAPVLAVAEESQQRLRDEVQDYTCKIIRRERIEGKMRPYDHIFAKVRHEQISDGPTTSRDVPFSVYLRFDKPTKVAGRELLYLEGRNAGKMLVRRGGRRLAYITTYLDPESSLAMEDNHYPVTQIGFDRLLTRLTEVINEDMKHEECNVQFFASAKIGDRVCTRIVVEHPVRRDHFRYHRAVVFLDDQNKLPIGYASYDWPERRGDTPVLVEEYIYTNVKLNPGLTDEDFSRANPEYEFLRKESVVAGQ